MKEITQIEFKQCSLEILKSIHDYCVKNNLHYSLAYGTMLGAVRHHGFIPWDDDIDIVMPRPDYEYFIRNFNKHSCNYKVFAPELNWNYFSPFANVSDQRTLLVESHNSHRGFNVGVKIDVFPLDGTPRNTNSYESRSKVFDLLNQVLAVKRKKLKYFYGRSIFKFLEALAAKLLLTPIPYSLVQKIIYKKAINYSYSTSEYVDNVVYNTYFGKRHLKTNYATNELMKFEDSFFYVASGFDDILKTIYGDYMKLPPKEKRVSHHNFTAWWK